MSIVYKYNIYNYFGIVSKLVIVKTRTQKHAEVSNFLIYMLKNFFFNMYVQKGHFLTKFY